uniref:Ig-like domain-containing protein n=1 Tax=Terrapene triunguis TaxID=2587831 RepID=A0A674IX13_9SAUR
WLCPIQGYNDILGDLFKCPSLPASFLDNIRVSKIAGSSIHLTCGDVSRADLVSVIWEIRPRSGNHCTLAYRTDKNKTDRKNCGERMDWKSSPETDSALQIRQVTLTDEGCYSCETVLTFLIVYTIRFIWQQQGPGSVSRGSVSITQCKTGSSPHPVTWDNYIPPPWVPLRGNTSPLASTESECSRKCLIT